MIEENILIEYKPGFYRELTKEEWFCYYYVKLNEIYDIVNWYDLPVVGNPRPDNGPDYLHDSFYRNLCFSWFKDVKLVKGPTNYVKKTTSAEKSIENIERAMESMRNFSTYLEMIGRNIVEDMETQKRMR